MSLLHAAVPLFFALIGLEWLVARNRRRTVYALHDSITDLGCGILSQICGVYLGLLSLGAYRVAGDLAAPHVAGLFPRWPAGGPLSSAGAAGAWITVFLLVDFGQYWMHRASHRVSILWACHLVHHSSEELNYTVALRNSSLHGLFLWVVPLPLAVAGVPWQAFAVCYGLNVAYQFWLHTRVIGRLGPLEWVLNTPSHHRVHHGRDPEYVDRNYGGVLIVWDRLFRTFAAERREPRYGVAPAVSGSDPVWMNLWGFRQIAREAHRAGGLRGALAALLGPPRWSGSPTAAHPAAEVPTGGRRLSDGHALAQFLLLLAATVASLDDLGRAPLVDVAAYGALAALTLTGVSAVLERRAWAFRFEVARLAAVGLAFAVPGLRDTGLLPAPLLFGYAALSLLGMPVLIRRASSGSEASEAGPTPLDVGTRASRRPAAAT
jgi:sterol desaturase/sphingolipid hydroxylase (fatty acid hydroxylase superfamily)